MSLTYTDSLQSVNCIVPWCGSDGFSEHDWPKAGAFVMLPFTNRLAPAQFMWQGQAITLKNGSPIGQGLHGFGHRRPWQLLQTTSSSAELQLLHTTPDFEWPWPFEASLVYLLSDDGLRVELSVHNTSAEVMPVSLGWHPFLPHATALSGGADECLIHAQRQHVIGLDGLGQAEASMLQEPMQTFSLPMQQVGTIAFENYSGRVAVPLNTDWQLTISSQHAPHLLIHIPHGLRYLCVEPIGTLPGALKKNAKLQNHLALAQGETRSLVCALGLEALV